MKKIILSTLLFLLSLNCFSKEKKPTPSPYKAKIGKFKIWKNETFQYYIERLNKEPILMQIEAFGSSVGIKEIKPLKQRKDISLIIYYGGSSGSKVEVNHFRAAVWSESQNRFLADIPYKDIVRQNSTVLEKSDLMVKKNKLIVKRNGLIRKEIPLE